VDAFLAWMQASALGEAVRAAGPWAYGVINLTHIVGIATLFGSLLLLDLRLLGLWPRLHIGLLSDAVVPVATIGFVIAATAGACMLATNALDYAGNPFLLIKFPAIALGVINVGVVNATRAWRDRRTRDLSRAERRQLAILGGISLACWSTALAAGRLIAYW
jgi:hypothetical protein